MEGTQITVATAAQMNAIVNPKTGSQVYNSTAGTMYEYNGSGWISIASGGTGTVTSISAGTGITCSPNPITSVGTISITSTAVTPGSYTNADITIDATGRITAATSGAAGSGTVSPGTINQLTWYAATGSTVSGLATGNDGVLITSGSGVPSISSTIPIATQVNITDLGTIGVGTWNATVIDPSYGGTGAANNSLSTITLAGPIAFTGAHSFTGNLTGNTSVTFPTSGTLATTATANVISVSGTAGQIGVSPTTGNAVVSIDPTYVGQASITTLGTITTGTWHGTTIDLSHGGTNNSLTASNGGVVWSDASKLNILSGTSTANQLLLSGASATPAWSTTTYPATNAINTLLYASAANVMSALPTAANGVLVTNGSSVPSIGAALPAAVQGNINTVGTVTAGTWAATPIAILYGGTGVTSVTTAPTATAFAGWDSHSNLSTNNLLNGYTTTATAAGTTTLNVGSTYWQFFTGTTTQTVVMPVVSTLTLGQSWRIVNNSTGVVTVQSSGANTIQSMSANTSLLITCIALTGTTAASWSVEYNSNSAAVSSVSGTTNRISATPNTGAVIVDIDAAYVGQTSITTLGTIGTGTWQGGVVNPVYGGTGIANASGSTITLGGAFAMSGAFGFTGTVTGTTAVTFPTSGTLATTATANVASVSGTANRVAVSPTTGATVVDIDAAYVGQTSIITLGHVTTGRWTADGISISFGGTGVTSVTTAPTSGAFAGWDLNSNLSTNNLLNGYTTTATAAGTTTLDVTSTYWQFFTGSTTQIVIMPVVSTLVLGQSWRIVNNSSGVVTVQSSATNTIQAMAANTSLLITCISLTGTTAASWSVEYNSNAAAVSSVSGTTNRISVSPNTGATVVDIDAAYVGQSSITTLGTITSGVWHGTSVDLTHGGTNNALTASNGGIVWSDASKLNILSGTATAGQLLQSGSSATPAWTTTTYPATNAINTLLYASSANTMAALATGNNGVLITSAGGVPSISSTLPSGITLVAPVLGTPASGTLTNCTGYPTSALTGLGAGVATWLATPTSANLLAAVATTNTGTGALVFASSPTLVTPTLGVAIATSVQLGANGLLDTNGNAMLKLSATASAVNQFTMANAATAGSPTISTTGTDSNIAFTAKGKGTSGCAIQGRSTNSNAAAGDVGEYIMSTVTSPISVTNNTAADVTSITLTAGDWNVEGNVLGLCTTNTINNFICWISSTSATIPASGLFTQFFSGASGSAQQVGLCTPFFRASVPTSTTLTVFLSTLVSSLGTNTAAGGIFARRV